jgi:adenylate cyclase
MAPPQSPKPEQPEDQSNAERPLLEPERAEQLSREILETGGAMRHYRRFFRSIPSSPRCKLCASPFGGVGGPIMRAVGKAPWPKNPRYCSRCFTELVRHRTGAEVECSLVFADVRGSTALAEGMRPGAFRELMGAFLSAASDVLVERDAIIDKFVGDEIVAIFIPGLTGARHAANAIAGAGDVVRVARRLGLPVGAGVNTGVAFVGAVGEGEHVEFTAMGDPVNVAARLASAAGAGEVLVTLRSALAGGLDTTAGSPRSLSLKGRAEPVDVVALTAEASQAG